MIAARAGGITIRVGGNTQDKAVLEMNGLPGGKTIVKAKDTNSTTIVRVFLVVVFFFSSLPGFSNPRQTDTPIVDFTLDLFAAMQAVGKLFSVGWFFGIPFIDTDADGNAGLIVSNSKSYLGDSLLGLQLANEPDL